MEGGACGGLRPNRRESNGRAFCGLGAGWWLLGYCLATLLRLPQSGHEVAVVVLGARSSAGRVMETRNLFEWLSKSKFVHFDTERQVLMFGTRATGE